MRGMRGGADNKLAIASQFVAGVQSVPQFYAASNDIIK